ncbi:MAG: LysR family transcriptional regulator [Clostridiales bacterium]|nr:LysR family transcriptional regulator [Clostridiales bacterium]
MNSMQIRCFLTAARCLNFTQSANELFISQPAFSYNISSLEQEWGIELFARSNKRKDTYLTPAGKVMYEGMKNLLEQYESILQKATNISEGKDGTLRIALSGADRIDERILNLFEHFHEKYPEIDITLLRGSSNDSLRGLFNNTIDIAFALKIEVEDKKWLAYKELFSLETVLLVNVKHPMAKKENLSLSDFRKETFVNISSKESPAINALLKVECEKAGFTPRMIDAPDIISQTLYMETGKGVAICSSNNIGAYKNRIVPLRLSDLKPLTLVMAWNPDNDNPCIGLFNSTYELIK